MERTDFKGSIKRQLVGSNVFLVILPTIVFLIVLVAIFKTNVLTEAEKYNEKLISQYTVAFDSYIEDMINISVLPMYDDGVQAVLKNESPYYIDKKYNEMYNVDKLKNFIFTLHNIRTEITGVFIYCADGRVFHNMRSRNIAGSYSYNNAFDYRESALYQAAKEANGKSVVVPTHIEEQVIPQDNEVISVVKLLKDLQNGSELGMILIDVNLSRIEQLSDTLLSDSASIVVVSDGQDVIYSNSRETASFMAAMTEAEGIRTWYSDVNGSQYLVTLNDTSITGWNIIRFVSTDSILGSFIGLIPVFVLIAALMIAAEILVTFRVSRHIVKPIRHMVGCMEEVETGDLSVRVKVADRNELGLLGDSFNKMLQNINQLVRKTYLLELEKKNAQIMALQSQINPHFLYNTLESVHMMAEINCDYETAEMVTRLGKMMRYAISEPNHMVFVRKELEYLDNYIEMECIQHDVRIEFRHRMDPDLENFEIPKLLFQPFIENSIKHGIKEGELLSIRFEGRKEADCVVFEISDNGIGMSPERLEEVRKNMKAEHIPEHSIGIYNVIHRVKLYYNNCEDLSITSQYGEGTSISLALKLKG